ncbi:DHHA1 domain-containing protein, partial [Bacteriovoracaceae bacterium]|nr:DHHA1 domain-containing protein [Bacteriovoracaceae bacterium]
MTIPLDLFKKYQVTEEDTHSFVNYLLVLNQVKVVCMFREMENNIKVSFRSTSTEIDVAEIAKALGGGGHNHSAATSLTINEPFDDAVEKAVTKIRTILKNLYG